MFSAKYVYAYDHEYLNYVFVVSLLLCYYLILTARCARTTTIATFVAIFADPLRPSRLKSNRKKQGLRKARKNSCHHEFHCALRGCFATFAVQIKPQRARGPRKVRKDSCHHEFHCDLRGCFASSRLNSNRNARKGHARIAVITTLPHQCPFPIHFSLLTISFSLSPIPYFTPLAQSLNSSIASYSTPASPLKSPDPEALPLRTSYHS